MARYISRAITLCVFVLMCLGWAIAATTGSIIGFVKDSTGALIPGVKITATSTATGAQLSTTSNETGRFEFPQLAPASYSLVVEAAGFKKTIVNALVQVDQITHVDFALQVGDIVQEVEVQAVAPILETDKSTMSSVVESRTIDRKSVV